MIKTFKKNYISYKLTKYFSNIDFNFVNNFSQDRTELQETVYRFCQDTVKPLAVKTDKENQFPNHLWTKFGEMGLLGATVPVEYGGSGMDYTNHCMIMEEISRASGSIGLSYGAHTALNIGQIERHGTIEQKNRYLPKLCSGEFVGALAMSEPNSGSDVVSMKTNAVKKDGVWILNGNKMWITNGPDANVIVVYAKTEHEGKLGITAFLLDGNSNGLSRCQKLDKFGMRGSNTCELVFDNVEIPEANILGTINKGVYILMSGLDYERLVLAAGPVGLMQNCMDITIPYLQTREQFKTKIGNFQLMQGKIADMFIKLQSSRGYMYSLAQAIDKTDRCSNADCAGVLLYTSMSAVQVALEAIQSLGGNGYMNEYEVERILRDSKLYEIGAGTNEIRRMIIGREMMKHNA